MPEIMGAGVALFDYDNDGDLDVYLVQGTMLDPTEDPRKAKFSPPPEWKPGNRLFRNLLSETGKLEFVDVTEKAGVGHVGYGMGVAIGDYDNDGYEDLYVTNFGQNVLYHNNGDGTFTDVTVQAGVDDRRWSTSASWVDYDHDGHLDLFVANYLDFTVKGNKQCYASTGERDYCTPKMYQPVPARLFHNRGDGTFEDVTEAAGIGAAIGPGLGVVCADFNGDGWPDIYVANEDRKSTRLNSSHSQISYAVFCLKKKTTGVPPSRARRVQLHTCDSLHNVQAVGRDAVEVRRQLVKRHGSHVRRPRPLQHKHSEY